MKVIARENLDALFAALRSRGYAVIGPTISDGAVVYDELHSADELPAGWHDEQKPGSYRLVRRDDDAVFAHVVGPHSWKRFLFPPVQRLFEVTRNGRSLTVTQPPADDRRFAFIGVRPCELEAIVIQDRVFTEGPFAEGGYQRRRENAFIVAVNCGRAAESCFCTSMHTGPRARRGFDLALTEIIDGDAHEFVVEAGSAVGEDVLDGIPHRDAEDRDESRALAIIDATARSIERRVDTCDIKAVLYRNYDSPVWERVASRCLSCANCTMVCPTCFCSTVEDVTDLTAHHAERWRKWDSCFHVEFSYIVGGHARASVMSRYRQWLTHKLGTWHDQFGTSGCVGCGRCITWCPAGIDITQEMAAMRGADRGAPRAAALQEAVT